MTQIARLSEDDIQDGNAINAEPLNDEFNQLLAESNAQDTRITAVEAGTFATLTATSQVKTDTINERTSAAGVTIDGVVIKDAGVATPVAATLTIASGAITVTGSYHRVLNEAAAATDDLVTINGGTTGRQLFLQPDSDSQDVIIKHGTGNILLAGGADVRLRDMDNGAAFVYSASLSKWVQTAFTPEVVSLATNHILRYDGNGWLNGQEGLTLLATASASTSATVDFATGLTTAFKRYLVKASRLLLSDGVSLNMLVSEDAGASYLTGGTDYTYGIHYTTGGASGHTGGIAAALILGEAPTVGEPSWFNLELDAPMTAGARRIVHCDYVCSQRAADNALSVSRMGGTYNGTGAINAIRFIPISGTILSGDFALYGVRG